MPPIRKYSGPLQRHKKSAYVPGTRRNLRKRIYGRIYAKRKYYPKLNYRTLNTYAFCRETIPDTKQFTIIPAGTSNPAMGYMNFDNLQFNQLVQSVTEFGALFARYKIHKVVTILTPMYQEQIASNNNIGYSTSSGLRITRVNTKYLNQPFNIQATSDAQLAELAQIQAKTVRPYASHYSMKLITKWPKISQRGVVDSTNTEIDVAKPMPWLNIQSQADVPIGHNSLIFCERTDGGSLTVDYKYRVVHKVYFRCAQVG